jgi:ABC-type sugar transport system substrate-binding protein
MSKLIRYTISLAAIAGMTLAVFAAPVSAHSAAKSKGTIAFLLSGPDLYYQYGLHGAEAAAAKLGYKVKAYPNPHVQASVELANVQNAIGAHVVAIDGYSVGLATEDASVAKAGAAGVPIFLMYGYSKKYLTSKDVVGFEQVNLQQYSYTVGKYVKSHVKSGKLAIITGQLGRGDAEGYQQGFLEGLGCKNPGSVTHLITSEKCGKITLVTSQTGGWLRPTAQQAASSIIGKYGDLKAMFVENEDMAVGAHTALVFAHKDKQVFMVSQNGAPYGLAGIKAGWLKASDTCSPALEGINSIRLVDAYLKHKIKGGHLYYSYKVFVTKANLGQAVGWQVYKNAKKLAALMAKPLPKPVPNNQLP